MRKLKRYFLSSCKEILYINNTHTNIISFLNFNLSRRGGEC